MAFRDNQGLTNVVDKAFLYRYGIPDFTVKIGDRKYQLHEKVLVKNSMFFRSLCRLTGHRTVTFGEDHLVTQNVAIWDQLVLAWYDHMQSIKIDFTDYQPVMARYNEICAYLMTSSPPLQLVWPERPDRLGWEPVDLPTEE